MPPSWEGPHAVGTREGTVIMTRATHTTRRRSRKMNATMKRRYEIVLAMADALEDILRWERRQVA